jgi:hypothetical protein
MVLAMLLGGFFSDLGQPAPKKLKGHHNEKAKSNEQAALARRFDFGSQLIFGHSRGNGRYCCRPSCFGPGQHHEQWPQDQGPRPVTRFQHDDK